MGKNPAIQLTSLLYDWNQYKKKISKRRKVFTKISFSGAAFLLAPDFCPKDFL